MILTSRQGVGAALALILCRAITASDGVDPSTLENKVLIGYQGWFTCPGDGSHRWTHWSRGVPTPETLTIEMYPDVSELDAEERCVIPGMTIAGKPAYLFSSRNAKTVSRHFRWMKEYGLDGVLAQRFIGEIRRKRADGADLPSDWYLKLAGEITRMFHGEIEPDARLPAVQR